MPCGTIWKKGCFSAGIVWARSRSIIYQQLKEGFACTSELPALACLREEPWQEDLDSSADYLRHGYYLPGTTAYKSIREVLPGHTLSWSPAEEPQEQSYWQLSIGSCSGSRDQACLDLRRSMIESVEKRMVADVRSEPFSLVGLTLPLLSSS